MQSYGVRRTHAESENKFNVTAQLKASEAAALVSRWVWSRLHTSQTDGQQHTQCAKFGSFLSENGDWHIFIWMILRSIILQTAINHFSRPSLPHHWPQRGVKVAWVLFSGVFSEPHI